MGKSQAQKDRKKAEAKKRKEDTLRQRQTRRAKRKQEKALQRTYGPMAVAIPQPNPYLGMMQAIGQGQPDGVMVGNDFVEGAVGGGGGHQDVGFDDFGFDDASSGFGSVQSADAVLDNEFDFLDDFSDEDEGLEDDFVDDDDELAGMNDLPEPDEDDGGLGDEAMILPDNDEDDDFEDLEHPDD